MAILTDLPNELLLAIIVDVSPLYIESFALSCKRIYSCSIDTIKEHNLVRGRLTSLGGTELLRAVVPNPRMALYPTFLKLHARDCCWTDQAPDDLHVEIDTLSLESPHADFLRSINTRYGYTIVPLLIICLLNVRKLDISVDYTEDLHEVFLQIVEASYESSLTLREPFALGKLTDVNISSPPGKYGDGMELAILLATIPSVRKLGVDVLSRWRPYSSQKQHRSSNVTEIIVSIHVDTSYLAELVGPTRALQRFAYNHTYGATLQSRRMIGILKEHAGQSLTYLSLLTRGTPYISQNYQTLHRNHNDPSLGSLREFIVLKTLVTYVDAFIKTRDSGEDKNECCTKGAGIVQRLVSWLPASLETLILHPGLKEWDKNALRLLFRGFRNNKQARLAKLKFIVLIQCPGFDQLMSDDIKSACFETGIKLVYTTHLCNNIDCHRVLEQLGIWEGRLWVEVLRPCCQPKDLRSRI